MDDARNLQYGIGFDTADAETSVENLGEKVETLEENIGAVEVGAQQMGASAVSACQMGQGAAERFTGAVGDASGGLDDMASSASEAGNAAQKAAGHWNMTAEGLEWVEEAAQAAEAAAESFRDEMDDSGGAAGRFQAQIKKTAESAQDMGAAFKGSMADGLDAETSVENLGEKVETLEENIGAVEVGAQQMGASAVSACQMGQGAAERFTGAVGDASGGLDDMASSASEAGNAAQKAAGHWNMTAEGLEWVEEAAQAAEAAAESFRDEMDDSGGAAGRFQAQIKKTAESAQDMGAAFKGSMADGLDAGQSIAKSFRTGVTGAMDFTKKRAEIFANNMVRNAKNISKAFQHPIKIIRSGLVSALRRAKKSEDETADGADDAGDHLAEMGAAGEDAGNQIKEAISGAVKAFVGFEAIKSGIELLKQFGAAAVSAFSDAESTSKKFGRSFSEEAAAWADNYADAVHRSTAEVQSFMVSNKAMYNELGITAAAAENLSEMTTSLAYDFGNAFSMDDSEALSLIQSAIGGSTDALNEYGIVLDKTALKNSAVALGLGTNIDALDDAAMAQVRLNAILEQSGDIQKAAVEQTGGLTNSIKSLKGEMADFMADAGEKFSPALEDMVGVFLDEWPELEPTLLEFVGILADGMSAAVPVISNLAQSILPSLISTLGTLFDAAGPVLSIIGDLAQEILPPLAGIISELAANALPRNGSGQAQCHTGTERRHSESRGRADRRFDELHQIAERRNG